MLTTLCIVALAAAAPLQGPSADSRGQAKPVISGRTVQAVGLGAPRQKGTPAQQRLLARRAAEVGAARNLAMRCGHGPGGLLKGFHYRTVRVRPDGWTEVMIEKRGLGTASGANSP
jgi:hypothetical protein